MSFEPLSSGSFFLVPQARTFASINVSGNATAHTRATPVGNGICFFKRRTFFRGHGRFCRPFGACPCLHDHPRLAPWAAFLRRFAADQTLAAGHALPAGQTLAAGHALPADLTLSAGQTLATRHMLSAGQTLLGIESRNVANGCDEWASNQR